MGFSVWFRRLGKAWRGLLEREEALWRAQLGEKDSPNERTADTTCDPSGTPPTLSELVVHRQSELKHDHSS
jgi:hypothetical protein